MERIATVMSDTEAFSRLARAGFNAVAYNTGEELFADVKGDGLVVKRDQVYKYWRQSHISQARNIAEKERVDKLAQEFRQEAVERLENLEFQRSLHWTKKQPRLKHKVTY